MLEFFSNLFSTEGFPPRWQCGEWTSGHGWLHILSDLGVWSAYTAIPLVLVYFTWRRRDIPFPRIFWLFAAFILACGTVHLLEAITFWEPAYRLLGVFKLFTALVSWLTVGALIYIAPQALRLPGLSKLNAQLADEVDERKRSEAATREEQEFSAAVLNSLTAHVAVLDRQGNIIQANDAWRRFANLDGTDEDLLGSNYFRAAKGDSEAAMTGLRRVLNGELDHFRHEYACHSASEEQWFLMHVTPLRSSRGGAVVSHMNITERKLAEARLEELAQRLQTARATSESANQSKSAFLANMSHEIRTPMTAVIGLADVLIGDEQNAERLEILRMIKQNGNYLIEILNDILDISKIEAGKLEIEHVRCAPAKITSSVASLMAVRAQEKHIDFDVEFDGPIPTLIQTDPVRVRQILVNLVGNAIKFTDRGRVQLLTRLIKDHDPPLIEFEVRDTGIGISPEQQQRLFEPFEQADSTVSRKFGGTGLGLSICSRLVAMLGGTISVDSEQGTGSVFRVRVPIGGLEDVSMHRPRHELAETEIIDTFDESASSLVGCRVLVAEDTQANRFLIRRLLEKTGAEVTLVENGREALEAVHARESSSEPFDIVVMDVQMPEISGLDATRQLRASGCSVPIVALTASAMKGDREVCLAAGCDDYLAKPIDRSELLRLIGQHRRSDLRAS